METITVTVQYRIKKKKLAKAKDAIFEYVDAVKKNEPGIIDYKVFQDKGDSATFVHMMSFVDNNAKKMHEKTEHLKKLKKILIPISKGKAVYTTLTDVKFVKSADRTEDNMNETTPSQESI